MWTKKLTTVLLPLASFLVLVATRKALCEATLKRSRVIKRLPDAIAMLSAEKLPRRRAHAS